MGEEDRSRLSEEENGEELFTESVEDEGEEGIGDDTKKDGGLDDGEEGILGGVDEDNEEDRGEEGEDGGVGSEESGVEEEGVDDEGGVVDACYGSDIAACLERSIANVAVSELGSTDAGVHSGKTEMIISFLKLNGIRTFVLHDSKSWPFL